MHANAAEWYIRPSFTKAYLNSVLALVTLVLFWNLLPPSKWQWLIVISMFVLNIIVLFITWRPLTLNTPNTRKLPKMLAFLSVLRSLERIHGSKPIGKIGINDNGWWIDQGNGPMPVRWHNGSIRKNRYLRLVWGFWPWQVLSIYPDSVNTAEDFRLLKFYLYGSL
ncbi:MAG: hypothetical protein P1U57_03180 [Oleibacter sp.]|nr:hypothetical protein [Thalassolituus sp.]